MQYNDVITNSKWRTNAIENLLFWLSAPYIMLAD